jgi:hypothetical protein
MIVPPRFSSSCCPKTLCDLLKTRARLVAPISQGHNDCAPPFLRVRMQQTNHRAPVRCVNGACVASRPRE